MYFWLTLWATSRGLLLVLNRWGGCDPPAPPMLYNLCSFAVTEPGPTSVRSSLTADRSVVRIWARMDSFYFFFLFGGSTAVHRPFARAHDKITTILNGDMKSYPHNFPWYIFFFFPLPSLFLLFPLPSAFGCLSFNKHLLYSGDISRRLLQSELQGSRTTRLSRSRHCQNVWERKKKKGNTRRRLFLKAADKIIMNIWELPPLLSPAWSWSTHSFIHFFCQI